MVEDFIEEDLGPFQVLISTRPFESTDHSIQGIIYDVAVPQWSMVIVPVYVIGDQDLYLEKDTVFLVRFVGTESLVGERGPCITAEYVEVVAAIRSETFSQSDSERK